MKKIIFLIFLSFTINTELAFKYEVSKNNKQTKLSINVKMDGKIEKTQQRQ